jgi:hypothetical protein
MALSAKLLNKVVAADSRKHYRGYNESEYGTEFKPQALYSNSLFRKLLYINWKCLWDTKLDRLEIPCFQF